MSDESEVQQDVLTGFESELLKLFWTQVRRLKNIGVKDINGVALVVCGIDPSTTTLHSVSGTLLPSSDDVDQEELARYQDKIFNLMVESFQKGPQE